MAVAGTAVATLSPDRQSAKEDYHKEDAHRSALGYGSPIGSNDRERRESGIEVAEKGWPELVAAAGFESMKKNADRTAPDTDLKMWKDNSRFFNMGTSGQWRGVLSGESLALLEEVKARYPADYIGWLFDGSD